MTESDTESRRGKQKMSQTERAGEGNRRQQGASGQGVSPESGVGCGKKPGVCDVAMGMPPI